MTCHSAPTNSILCPSYLWHCGDLCQGSLFCSTFDPAAYALRCVINIFVFLYPPRKSKEIKREETYCGSEWSWCLKWRERVYTPHTSHSLLHLRALGLCSLWVAPGKSISSGEECRHGGPPSRLSYRRTVGAVMSAGCNETVRDRLPIQWEHTTYHTARLLVCMYPHSAVK